MAPYLLHVLVVLYIVGALTGVAAAVFVNHYRLVYGHPFFAPWVRSLLWFSLLLLVLLSTYYAAANLGGRVSAASPWGVAWVLGNTFVGFAAFSGWLVSFLQVQAAFEARGLTPRARWLLGVVVATAFTSYVVGFWLSRTGGGGWWLNLSRDLYNLSVPVILIVAIIGQLRRIARRELVISHREVRAFLLLHLGAYSVLLILPAVFRSSGLLWLAVVLGATSALPFLWLSRYFRPEPAAGTVSMAERPPIETIAERHQLTNREAEIVAHVLNGSSNAEIAEALFISVGTVKNHIYSVFRKLGIRSRGQLHRMVREPPHRPDRPGR